MINSFLLWWIQILEFAWNWKKRNERLWLFPIGTLFEYPWYNQFIPNRVNQITGSIIIITVGLADLLVVAAVYIGFPLQPDFEDRPVLLPVCSNFHER